MICVIPFFNGHSSAAHSAIKTRVSFLRSTIESHSKLFDQIYIGVCNYKDYDLISGLGYKVNCILIDSSPIFLPASFMREVKKLSFDFIYYSEADQKIFCSILPEMINVLNKHKDVFFIPRRFFKTLHGSILNDGPLRTTLQAHSKDPLDIEAFDQIFYIETDMFRGFGGSWLCSKSFFEKINFQFCDNMPIEHTSCFDLFLTKGSKALMSIDPFDFWVEHLSGNEIADKRNMFLI